MLTSSSNTLLVYSVLQNFINLEVSAIFLNYGAGLDHKASTTSRSETAYKLKHQFYTHGHKWSNVFISTGASIFSQPNDRCSYSNTECYSTFKMKFRSENCHLKIEFSKTVQQSGFLAGLEFLNALYLVGSWKQPCTPSNKSCSECYQSKTCNSKHFSKSLPQPDNPNWKSGHAIMAWSTPFKTGCDWKMGVADGCNIYFRETGNKPNIDNILRERMPGYRSTANFVVTWDRLNFSRYNISDCHGSIQLIVSTGSSFGSETLDSYSAFNDMFFTKILFQRNKKLFFIDFLFFKSIFEICNALYVIFNYKDFKLDGCRNEEHGMFPNTYVPHIGIASNLDCRNPFDGKPYTTLQNLVAKYKFKKKTLFRHVLPFASNYYQMQIQLNQPSCIGGKTSNANIMRLKITKLIL